MPDVGIQVSKSSRQSSLADINEVSADVAPQTQTFGGNGDKIEQPIIVIIEKLGGHRCFGRRRRRRQLEAPVPVAHRKDSTPVSAQKEISKSVFVNVACRGTPERALAVESDFSSHVAKCAVAQIAKKPRRISLRK